MGTTTNEDKDSAKAEALAQVASITEMVAALEVDYERMVAIEDEFANAEGPAWKPREEADALLAEYDALKAAAGDCTSREDAKERCHENALDVQVRSDWYSPGESNPVKTMPSEFRIVLCTGGPHVEVRGELNYNYEPSLVRVIHEDWGTSGELFDFDRDAVLTYCQQFYFGE